MGKIIDILIRGYTVLAQIAANIHERLRLESCAIPVEEGRFVLALRIPNSTSRHYSVFSRKFGSPDQI